MHNVWRLNTAPHHVPHHTHTHTHTHTQFYDANYNGDGQYDPEARRKGQKVTSAGTTVAPTPKADKASKPASAAKAAPAAARTATKAAASSSSASAQRSATSPKAPSSASAASGAPSAKTKELETRCTELQLVIDGLEKERDFYFSKLRDIEVCATLELLTVCPSSC
jgi:RP/EB family microtubule-associated protein